LRAGVNLPSQPERGLAYDSQSNAAAIAAGTAYEFS
jgi:hypothetical protein